VYKPAICELSLTLDFLSNLRSPLFREKTSGLEMRIGKRNRFTGKRVDVIRGEGSPVGKDFNPMAAKKNTFRTLPTDPVFSRASEKTHQTFTLSAGFKFQ
jgi:hypothetical protein